MASDNSYLYHRLRSLILPLYQIDQELPKKGKITELGCGQGIISKYLSKEKKREITGIDMDKKRIPKFSNSNLKFKVADITKIKYPKQDAFVISDVLHHLSHKDQKNLLSNIFKSTNKNGFLVIKEIDAEDFLRSKLSRFWDFIFYPKDRISYQKSSELKKYLRKLGFDVNVKKACQLFPGSTILFVCKKNG